VLDVDGEMRFAATGFGVLVLFSVCGRSEDGPVSGEQRRRTAAPLAARAAAARPIRLLEEFTEN
jgi:hypothetical protein